MLSFFFLLTFPTKTLPYDNERVLKKEKVPIKYDDSQYFEENAIKLSDSKHMHTDLENTYDFIM